MFHIKTPYFPICRRMGNLEGIYPFFEKMKILWRLVTQNFASYVRTETTLPIGIFAPNQKFLRLPV